MQDCKSHLLISNIVNMFRDYLVFQYVDFDHCVKHSSMCVRTTTIKLITINIVNVLCFLRFSVCLHFLDFPLHTWALCMMHLCKQNYAFSEKGCHE